jgi:ribosomal peptide maturation radical SAM protein 1
MSHNAQVVLVNMPFGNLDTPSIGLGLLKGALLNSDIQARIYNFQIRFAELIGHDDYVTVYGNMHTEELAGEFIFSNSLFGADWATDVERYIDDVLRRKALGSGAEAMYDEAEVLEFGRIIYKARAKVEHFLCECLQTICSVRPDVVGFTSLFHQHVASLSLAKRIKRRLPKTCILFGGANCEGTMGAETIQQFEFVDAVVSGEADFVFPQVVKQVVRSGSVPKLDGVLTRSRSELHVLQQRPSHTAMVEKLDLLPLPDYDDYFAEREASSITFARPVGLLFETSRGCWWGEKHHCTFCGLNGETMRYRSKSAKRALDEFVYLTQRYPGCSVNAVDNILDMTYFSDFLPLLAQQHHGLKLFYEVKANLRKEQLRLLLNAGVREIQPGIESFSDHVLTIMRKGVSALQNIQLIKMCRELGIKVFYNLIWGFPGESSDDYADMARLVPLISHLTPPVGEGAIRIDRFSPSFEQATELGFGDLLPHPAYSYVYPFNEEALTNLAYFFVSADGSNSEARYTRALANEVQNWRTCHAQSDLFWMQTAEYLLIWDFRPIATEVLTVLSGIEKLCYVECEQIRTPQQVVLALKAHAQLRAEQGQVSEILDSFTNRNLMIRRGNSYLALAYEKSH